MNEQMDAILKAIFRTSGRPSGMRGGAGTQNLASSAVVLNAPCTPWGAAD